MSSVIEKFQVKNNSIAFRLLTENLYKNKFKSVIREIVNNSYDACITRDSLGLKKPNGKSDIDININFINKEVNIRDYGLGLNKEDMTNMYTTYFQSNKTNDSKTVGGFGIGSKSPLALVNEFMSTSYYNGKKLTLLIFLDSNDMPTYSIVEESDTTESNGLEVSFKIPAGYDIKDDGAVDDDYMLAFLSMYTDIDISYNEKKVEHIKLLDKEEYDDVVLEIYQSYLIKPGTFSNKISVFESIDNKYSVKAIVKYKNNLYPLIGGDYDKNYIMLGTRQLGNLYSMSDLVCVTFKDESMINLALSRESIDNELEILNKLSELSDKYFNKTFGPVADVAINSVSELINSIKKKGYVEDTCMDICNASFKDLEDIIYKKFGYNTYTNTAKDKDSVIYRNFVSKLEELELDGIKYSDRDDLSRLGHMHSFNDILFHSYLLTRAQFVLQEFKESGLSVLNKGDSNNIIFRFNNNYQTNKNLLTALYEKVINMLGIKFEIKNFMVLVIDSCADMSAIKSKITKIVGSNISYFARVFYVSGEDRNKAIDEMNKLKEKSICPNIETLVIENDEFKGIKLTLGFDSENMSYYSKGTSNHKITVDKINKSIYTLCDKNVVADILPYLGYIKNDLKEIYILDSREEKVYKMLREKCLDNDLLEIINKFINKEKIEEYISSFYTLSLASLLVTDNLHNIVVARNLEKNNIMIIKEYISIPTLKNIELLDNLKSHLSYIGYKISDNFIFEEVEKCKKIISNKKYIKTMFNIVDLVYKLCLSSEYMSAIFSKIINADIKVSNIHIKFESRCPSDISELDYIELDKDKKQALKMLTHLQAIGAIEKIVK